MLRPIGSSSLTDADELKAFIGTLQYSSPEFLLRTEKDTIEGWRAVTFYQIGAVLHDLVMRKSLFQEFKEPFARLVNAIQHEVPQIKSDSVSSELENLAGRCLLKDPELRLKFVSWADFELPTKGHNTASARRRVTNRVAVASAAMAPSPTSQDDQFIFLKNFRHEVLNFLKESIRSIRLSSQAIPHTRSHAIALANHEAGLCISIERSDKHVIHTEIHLFIKVVVDDIAAKAINIIGIACTADEAPPPDFDHAFNTQIFSGIYDGDLILPALENYIFSIVDAAQSNPAKPVGKAHWFGSIMG